MAEQTGLTGNGTSTGRILVVEENLDLLEALQEMLEAMGFEVAAFSGEVQAIAAIATRSSSFDLLIGDAAPAIGDGVGLVDRLRARTGPMPALLLAGAGMSEGLRRRVEAGEIATLAAPFSARQLADAVADAMAMRERVAVAIDRRVQVAPEIPLRAPAGAKPVALRWALPLAAGLALAVGLSMRQRESGPPPMPPNVAGQEMRGGAIEALEPRGDLDRSPERFVWQLHPDAQSYVLSVLRVDESLAWRRVSTQPAAEVPADATAIFVPAVTYYWLVEALDASGNPLTRSARMEFRVQPGSESEPRLEEKNP